MVFENLKLQPDFSKKVHFIGLGGIGMSALALLLNKVGVKVQGSDLNENYITKTLRERGIAYFVGHDRKNIDDDISLIVETSIIKADNPEILAAQEKGIKIITRAQLLALVMSYKKGITIAGTHGKTSTTAITSLMLEFAGLDPIVINGGIINYFQSNYKLGDGDFIVAESDESDGSFVTLPTFVGAVTNIEPEHLEFYNGDFEKAKSFYEKYVTQIPQNGLCVMCIDDVEVEKIYDKLKNTHKNLRSYSIKKDADIMAKNIVSGVNGSDFDVFFKDGRNVIKLHIPSYGIHNVSNALAAIGIADFLQIKPEIIKKSLENFSGVKRRFTKVGEVDGVLIIDDYAHHPTEIAATLQAARQFAQKNKVILVLQPHKYTRIRDLFDEFATCVKEADIVILTDIYAASQKPIEGISQDSIFANIKKFGHKNVVKLNSENDLAGLIKKYSNAGDIVLCAGAGTITNFASKLPQQLQDLKNAK